MIIRYNFDESFNEMQGAGSVEGKVSSSNNSRYFNSLRNIQKKLSMIDRGIAYQQIEEILKIGASAVYKILNEYLIIRMVCSFCVLHDLKLEQK